MPKTKPTLVSESGENILEYYDKSHRYYLNKKPIRSMTSLGSAYPKADKLLEWQMEVGKKTAAQEMNKAAKIGTFVHDYIYYLRMNQPKKLIKLKAQVDKHKDKDTIYKGMRAAKSWNKWTENQLEKAEVITCSPKLWVAGKFDELSKKKDGRLGVVDYKTSKYIYITQFHQAAGYRRIIKDWFDIETEFLEIVRFDKTDGEFHVATIDDRGLWYDGDLKLEDVYMLSDMNEQFIRNVGTAKFMRKYDKFWEIVR